MIWRRLCPELINVGLGAVFVPLPTAVDDHQTRNARALVNAEAALVIQQHGMDAQSLAAAIRSLRTERDALLDRAQKARALRGPDAVGLVVAQCAEILEDPALEAVS